MQKIIDAAAAYAAKLLTEKLPPEFIYHDLTHTLDVVKNVIEIGTNSNFEKEKLELVQLAAIFHDTGWTKSIKSHEEAGSNIAREFLASQNVNETDINEICELILSTEHNTTPKTLGQKILHDSDILHIGKKKFYSKSLALKSEIEQIEKRKISELSWIEFTLDYFEKNNFLTDYVIENYSNKRQKNISKLNVKKNEIMATENNNSNGSNKIKNSDKSNKELMAKKTGRGVETMFRNVIRTHVEFSSMADSKANIMISVNTIILTGVVAFLAKSLDTNPYLMIPSAILTLMSLVTLISAITVTRPKVNLERITPTDKIPRKKNLLFFGNFNKMSYKEFETEMIEMIDNSDHLYESMIEDYYHLGKVLGEKYRRLRICYTIFMYGMIISVAAFVIAIALTPSSAVILP